MKANAIIGREYERQLLNERYNSKEAELVIVYGRRRVGKTFLIKQHFDKKMAFHFTGVYNKPKQTQLTNFAIAMQEFSGNSLDIPKDWMSAFMQLKNYLKTFSSNKRLVVFIDEMPWLATPKSDFLSAFEWFWNGWGATQRNLMLIVCGSATTWITDKLLSNKGGLFNRLTLRMYINPFTLHETELYLKSKGLKMSKMDIAECYMIMGGIPFYLKQLSATMPYNANIDNIFFKSNALLNNEFDLLYKTLFNNSDTYIKLVEILSQKNMGLTRKEIVETKLFSDNGVLTTILKDLIASGFVMAYNFYGSAKKDTLYQICDFFTLFYFRFIKGKNIKDENFWSHTIDNQARKIWAGYSFEMLCKIHINQIRKALSIGAVLTECSSWFSREDGKRGCQIDLLMARRDKVINICEMKFVSGVFVIDNDYEENIRNKIEVFRRVSKTSNALHFTMITTFGVKKNSHYGLVQSELTLSDLFND